MTVQDLIDRLFQFPLDTRVFVVGQGCAEGEYVPDVRIEPIRIGPTVNGGYTDSPDDFEPDGMTGPVFDAVAIH